jgi:hypothetical protein
LCDAVCDALLCVPQTALGSTVVVVGAITVNELMIRANQTLLACKRTSLDKHETGYDKKIQREKFGDHVGNVRDKRADRIRVKVKVGVLFRGWATDALIT